MKNPLKADPSRTTLLRRAFEADMHRRFNALRRAISNLIITEDVFGIRADMETAIKTGKIKPTGTFRKVSTDTAFNSGPTTNTRWRFETDDVKLEEYRKWLQQQVDLGILEVVNPVSNEPWAAKYIHSAYKKGLIRAYVDAHREDFINDDLSFVEGGKESFVNTAFNSPTGQSKIRMLYTRTYSNLKAISSDIDIQMSRILADGIARGDGARKLARDLNKSLTTIEKKRALVLARTELIHAHAEGQLDSFEALGVEEVGVLAEWSTAGDDRVCPQCQPLEGVVLLIKEARGLIPRHPSCRCAWTVAGVGEKDKNQITGKEAVRARLQKSIKAEHPKLKTKEARAASKWAGADVNPSRRKTK